MVLLKHGLLVSKLRENPCLGFTPTIHGNLLFQPQETNMWVIEKGKERAREWSSLQKLMVLQLLALGPSSSPFTPSSSHAASAASRSFLECARHILTLRSSCSLFPPPGTSFPRHSAPLRGLPDLLSRVSPTSSHPIPFIFLHSTGRRLTLYLSMTYVFTYRKFPTGTLAL